MKPFAEAAESKREGRARGKCSPMSQTGEGGRTETHERWGRKQLSIGLQRDESLRCFALGQLQES